MADVNNKIDVRGDGSVVLYQRGNRDGSINEIFQMRISVPLTASKGYFRGRVIPPFLRGFVSRIL